MNYFSVTKRTNLKRNTQRKKIRKTERVPGKKIKNREGIQKRGSRDRLDGNLMYKERREDHQGACEEEADRARNQRRNPEKNQFPGNVLDIDLDREERRDIPQIILDLSRAVGIDLGLGQDGLGQETAQKEDEDRVPKSDRILMINLNIDQNHKKRWPKIKTSMYNINFICSVYLKISVKQCVLQFNRFRFNRETQIGYDEGNSP